MREYSTPSARSHRGSAGTYHRNAFRLLTAANSKTPKGEELGYLSAILYLSPHTLGGPTLCPYSTDACRAMCLAGAGLSGLPLQTEAKARRTRFYHEDRPAFLRTLKTDILDLIRLAEKDGLKAAVRLNGTSDILWEREIGGFMEQMAEEVVFYDYSKTPMEYRAARPKGYHLTFSIEGPESMALAIEYLRAGQSVAAVVPGDVKRALDGGWIDVGGRAAHFIDGDDHDLRFLDPPASIVLLKPKGRIVTSLMRPDIRAELLAAARVAA